MKKALKEKNELRLSTLRLALAAIANKEIELCKKAEGLSEEETIRVLKSEEKKRRDAAMEFRRAGREEVAQKEEQEASIIKEYLPAEMPDEELKLLVQEAIKETRASDIQSMGAVMKAAMPKIAGRAAGDRVSTVVKSLLSKL